DLAADDDHGDRVHVGRGDAGDGIGHARPAGHQADAGLVGGSGVGIGGMDGRLFVPHEDVLEFVLLVDCVVDVEDRAAGVAKHMVYAFLDQTTHDDVGAIEFHVDSFLDPCRAPSGLSAAWASTGDPRHD